MTTNLKEISNFIKKNNSYSDFNLVDNFLSNLNYTKLNFKNNNLIGGNNNTELNLSDKPDTSEYKITESNGHLLIDEQIKQIQKSTLDEQIQKYTIVEETILYHCTTDKKNFDTNYLNFGEDKLINFFTPNFKLASDKIERYFDDKQNGYIHVFKVIKNIPNIYVGLSNDIMNNINSGLLVEEFCSKNKKYNGIGFFYPKNNIEMFLNNNNNQEKNITFDNLDKYYSEYGLCNPKSYLKYLYSYKYKTLN